MPAFRSAPVCGTGYSAYNFGGEANRREQINALTAFLDLSQVYGSEDKLALSLRNLTNDGGLMRVNSEFWDNGRELLPFNPLNANMCATRKRVTNVTNAREVPCFIAGESTFKVKGQSGVITRGDGISSNVHIPPPRQATSAWTRMSP